MAQNPREPQTVKQIDLLNLPMLPNPSFQELHAFELPGKVDGRSTSPPILSYPISHVPP